MQKVSLPTLLTLLYSALVDVAVVKFEPFWPASIRVNRPGIIERRTAFLCRGRLVVSDVVNANILALCAGYIAAQGPVVSRRNLYVVKELHRCGKSASRLRL